MDGFKRDGEWYSTDEVWTETDVERACQTAFLSGWNAARNFPALDVDQAWQDWKDYLATDTGAANGGK